jgi:heme-degrading monooxygenase HmoA
MHARVTTFQVQPGKIDEVIDITRDSVLPDAREQKGFRGELLLTDRNASKVIAVSLWEAETDMIAGEIGDYLPRQGARLADLISGQTIREHYEVSVQA